MSIGKAILGAAGILAITAIAIWAPMDAKTKESTCSTLGLVLILVLMFTD